MYQNLFCRCNVDGKKWAPLMLGKFSRVFSPIENRGHVYLLDLNFNFDKDLRKTALALL
jgi:hypothetical protein